MTFIDITEATCEICDKPFRVVDEFVPWGEGVAHVRCWEEEEN